MPFIKNNGIEDINIFFDFMVPKPYLGIFKKILERISAEYYCEEKEERAFILKELSESIQDAINEIAAGEYKEVRNIPTLVHILELEYILDAIKLDLGRNKDKNEIEALRKIYDINTLLDKTFEPIIRKLLTYPPSQQLSIIDKSWKKYIMIKKSKSK